MKSLIGLLIAVVLLAQPCFAGSVSLRWDQHTDPSVTGYRVWWGAVSRSYTSSATVTGIASTTYTVSGLNAGTYYFAVTAFSATSVSDYSNEVSALIPLDPPKGLTIVNITAEATKKTVTIQWATSVPSSGRVRWGETAALANTAEASGVAEQHIVYLGNLRTKRVYYFQIESFTESETIRSDIMTFYTWS